MPRLVEVECLVLDRAPSGEKFLRLTLLTPAPGLLTALVRHSRTAPRPDVFDLATALLDAPAAGLAPGSPFFLREYKVVRRHTGLARRLPALETAAALANLISRHASHFETCAPVFDLCRKALAALDDGAAPEAVHLKALFLLARAEGYPAREHWLPTLAPDDQTLALAVLNRPTAEAAALAAGSTGHLAKLRRAFERWLDQNTDFETVKKPASVVRLNSRPSPV